MTADPIAIDPRGCRCTECLTGLYIPLDQATAGQVAMAKAGHLRDNTSGELDAVPDSPTASALALANFCAHLAAIHARLDADLDDGDSDRQFAAERALHAMGDLLDTIRTEMKD